MTGHSPHGAATVTLAGQPPPSRSGTTTNGDAMTIVSTPADNAQRPMPHLVAVRSKAFLALSILDHRCSTRPDDPAAELAHLQTAIRQARLALDGWTLEALTAESL